MPKRVTIEPHLSVEELENGYRQASEPVERTHYQIIWLLAKGMTTKEVVAVTGYSRSWIYELVWGYNRTGPETLGDQRTSNQGSSKPLMMYNRHYCGRHYNRLQPREGNGMGGR